MSEILAMSGVQLIGIIQKRNIENMIISFLVELVLISIAVLGYIKSQKGRDTFYIVCVTCPAILLSIIVFGGPILASFQKENYVQVRVLHDSEAAFRILEEYDDVEIDGSTFTIKLDNLRKDE